MAQQLTSGSLDLIEMYKQATKDPFSYLMINLTQECNDDLKYLSHLFNQKKSIKSYTKTRGQIQQINLVKYNWGNVCFPQIQRFSTTPTHSSINAFDQSPQVSNDNEAENTETNQKQGFSVSIQTEPSQNTLFEAENSQLIPNSNIVM